jgi:hemoglobin
MGMPKNLVITCAALTAALILVSCALEPAKPLQEPSLYQRLGGIDAINPVVADAIGNIAADARINRRFSNAASVSHLNRNLVDLICVRTGGPCKYSGLDMSAAHEGMDIRDDEFDDLVEDLVKSLEKFKVPAREKAEVLAILNQMKNAIVGH